MPARCGPLSEPETAMTLRIAIACIALGASLTAVGCSTNAGTAHRQSVLGATEITTKVKAKLANASPRSLIHVHVDTGRDGVVVLSGTVKNEEDADQAVQLARDTDGVVEVLNKLAVRPDE